MWCLLNSQNIRCITWCKEEQIDSKWCNCYPRVTWWTPVNSPHQLTSCCIAADAWQWGSRWIMGIFIPARSILLPRRQIPVTESTILVYALCTCPAILYNLKLYMKIVISNKHHNWYWHDIFTLTLKHMYLHVTFWIGIMLIITVAIIITEKGYWLIQTHDSWTKTFKCIL